MRKTIWVLIQIGVMVGLIIVSLDAKRATFTGEQVEAGLTKVLRRDSPDAQAWLTGIKFNKEGTVMQASISCRNCAVRKGTDGPQFIVPFTDKNSYLIMTLDRKLNKWKLTDVTVFAPGGGASSYGESEMKDVDF